MTQKNLTQAAAVLFTAIGLEENPGKLATPADIQSFLRGSGVELKPIDIVNGIIPSINGTLGGILEYDDGHFRAFIGGNGRFFFISPERTETEPLKDKDILAVRHAWLALEKIIGLDTIVPFLRRYGASFADLFTCALIINLFALVLPLFSSFVYDKILGNGIVKTLWALVIALCFVIGIEFCVRMVRLAVSERFAISSETDIDYSLFRKLMDTSAGKIPPIGSLLEKYKQILSMRDFLSSSYLMAFADIPFIVLFLVTIMLVAGPLVLVGAICGALMLSTGFFFMQPVIDYDHVARKAGEKRFGLMTDLLSSRDAVIGSALRDDLLQRWRQASVAAVTATSKARYWRGLGMTVANSISYISFIGVLAGGVYMVEDHSLTSGGLLAASMLTSRMVSGFSSVITLIIRYREFRGALRELNELVPAVHKTPHNNSYVVLKGAVRAERVTCRLKSGGLPVLDNISFNIRPGEIVGIAGAPGAGKTTLLRLIAGVLHPDAGHVLIDDVPVEHLSFADITRNIGFKPQDYCLFEGTIGHNVRAGRPPLTAEERQDILAISGLSRAFQESGLNWETEIGARGISLSGGQRQLVSLARAMLRHPALLLLDEPTNGLDAGLEVHLAKQIQQSRGKRTIIVSTHSRNILSICDRIIVVGQSHILADGPRETILASA